MNVEIVDINFSGIWKDEHTPRQHELIVNERFEAVPLKKTIRSNLPHKEIT